MRAKNVCRAGAWIMLAAVSTTGAFAAAAQDAPAAQPAPDRVPGAVTTPAPPPPMPPTPPEVGVGPAISLEEAVTYAQQHNPQIGQAAAQIRQARATVTQTRALRGPQAGVNNYIFRQGPVIPSSIPGGNPAVPGFRWNVGAFVNQSIFDWGERASRQSAAERRTAAAQAGLAETQNNVRLVVSTAFYNVLRAQGLLGVAQDRRAAAAEQLRVAQARFQSDVSPRYDVLRAEAELASADQDVIAAQNDVASSAAAFNTSLGRDVTTAVNLSPTERNAEDVTFEQAREAAIRNRPQLEALRQEIRGTEAEIRARRAENKPQVGLGATYDRPNPGGFASSPQRYSVGLTMTFPFFDSGLTRGRVREAQGLREEQQQVLEQNRQQVELDVRQAQLDIIEARRRIDTATTELASARETLRVANVRYQAGVGTTLEVTDAQAAVSRAGQDLENARFDLQTAISRLEAATGTRIDQVGAGAAAPPAQPLNPAPPPANTIPATAGTAPGATAPK